MREVSSPNAWVAPFTPHMLQLLSKSLIVGVVVICFYGGNNCVVHNFKIFWIENPVTQKYQSRISFLSCFHDTFGFWAGWLPFSHIFRCLVRIVCSHCFCCVIGTVDTTHDNMTCTVCRVLHVPVHVCGKIRSNRT